MNLDQFLEKLSQKIEISVGFPEDSPAKYPGTDIRVASIAYLQDEGGIGESGNVIPSRPFLTEALDKNKRAIIKHLIDIYKPANFGKKKYLEDIGKKLKSMVQDSIDKGDWVPNADRTIEKKGKGKPPLIDTGRMRRSVTYRIKVE